MLKSISEIIRYRELLYNLVLRDIRVRYKNSFLGFFWSLIIPLAQVVTLTVVFKVIMRIDIPNYSAYLLCAIIPYAFFQACVLESTTSIIAHAGIVKKTYFPREILPIAIVISNFLHFILAMVVFFLYLIGLRLISGNGQPPILITWLLLPLVALINLALNTGIALYLAALNTYYEDIKYLTTVLLNLFFYALPILYMAELPLSLPQFQNNIIGKLLWVHYNLNPLCYLISAYRKILLPPFNSQVNGLEVHTTPLSYEMLGVAAVLSLVVLITGYAFFNSKKWSFAERL